MLNKRLELTWYNKDMALIPTEAGRYGYKWVNPSDPRYCETHTLIYDEYIQGEQSPKSDEYQYSPQADYEPQTKNLMILGESGDVLETITRVPELAKDYLGQIKLVYIDPPFNTSKAFESYEDNLEHSVWLTMMRDRLLHIRRLLSDDGSVWVHLDSCEVHRMRMLLDEVFGAGRFVSEVSWEKTFKPKNDSGYFSSRHDVILVYSKSEKFKVNRLNRDSSSTFNGYSNPDGDPKGLWTSAPATAPGAKTHQGMVYGIQHPITGEMIYPSKGRDWNFGQKDMKRIMKQWNESYELKELNDAEKRAYICNVSVEEVKSGVQALVIPNFDAAEGLAVYKKGNWPLIYITKKGQGGFRKKTYLCDTEDRVVEDMWFQADVGSNDRAKNEIKALFPGESPFATPKPEKLLQRIIHIATNPGDIVLDCFAGSGTTAAVAQKMGRRWVICELLEDNFNRYTKPRLVKVVKDQDEGGITRTTGKRVAAPDVELPDGVLPDDAAKFTSVLNKLITDDKELKKHDVIKKLKALAKTQNEKEVINWRGGGGFQVAHLSPACFDYSPELGIVFMTEAAKGENLVKSVVANLEFNYIKDTPGTVFDGRRGKNLLKVIDGVATREIIDWLVSQLESGEMLVVAATGVMDGVREYLRSNCKGGKVLVIPDDLFNYVGGAD